MAYRSLNAGTGDADLNALLREFRGLRLDMKTIKADMSAMSTDMETMGTGKGIQSAEGNEASKGQSTKMKCKKSSQPWFISFAEFNADMEGYELRDEEVEDCTSVRIEFLDSIDVRSPPSSAWAVLSKKWSRNHNSYGVLCE